MKSHWIILYTNIEGLLSKRSEFWTVIHERKSMIIALTEIKEKTKIQKTTPPINNNNNNNTHKKQQAEINLTEYSIPGYDFFVNEQPPKRGVAIH